VLVVGGMAIALLGTDEASLRTCFDHGADKPEIRGGLARHDSTGCVTGVGAVEAEANAANHFAHVLLGEIRVGTTRAADDTVEARLDTAHERIAILDGRLWMHPEDLLKVHVSPLSFESRVPVLCSVIASFSFPSIDQGTLPPARTVRALVGLEITLAIEPAQ
jgi:hypothetical protein